MCAHPADLTSLPAILASSLSPRGVGSPHSFSTFRSLSRLCSIPPLPGPSPLLQLSALPPARFHPRPARPGPTHRRRGAGRARPARRAGAACCRPAERRAAQRSVCPRGPRRPARRKCSPPEPKFLGGSGLSGSRDPPPPETPRAEGPACQPGRLPSRAPRPPQAPESGRGRGLGSGPPLPSPRRSGAHFTDQHTEAPSSGSPTTPAPDLHPERECGSFSPSTYE